MALDGDKTGIFEKGKDFLKDLGGSLLGNVNANIDSEVELGEDTKKLIYVAIGCFIAWLLAKIFKLF